MRYVVVSHSWFIDSNGFATKTIDAKDDKSAKEHATLIRDAADSTFNRTATIVLKIGPKEELYQPRRLTLWERLTGYAR
jgi:hypothetical protein